MFFKVLNADGTSCNGGNAQWSLPVQNADGTWTPGDWMPAIEGELISCENGYHLAEDAQVLEWLGPLLCEAEYRGERVDCDNKLVVRECRLLRSFTAWNGTTARAFARWCALQVAHLWDMPAVVREYLEIGNEALRAAASAAARAAARDAARDAASAAAWDAASNAASAAAWAAASAAAWDAASNAAWAAACNAAWAAASNASWAAAWDAQYKHLCELLEL